ncbi:MAG: quercetin dioxygenase-like cupin family protein [Gammaproteobacteria bacterium]|jgi:quercetin dioxygenase-like cupin family protein
MGSVLSSKDFEAARKLKEATLTELAVVPVCVAPGAEIFGHSHNMIEEVVIVHKGKGKIQIENETSDVCAGSVAVIPAGQFHALCNTGKKNLEATVVYNSNVNREKVKLRNRAEHFGGSEPSVADLCAEIQSLKKAHKKLKKKSK